MKINWICWTALSFVLGVTTSGWSQDTPLHLTFSGNSEAENQITIQGAGFDTYPRGTITYGPIPADNAFPNATDGRGAVISCAPGQGLMIFTPVVQSQGAVMIRCSVRAGGPQGSIVMATIDQGANTFVATNTPNNGAYFLNQYKRLALLSLPAAGGIQSLIQIVNPSKTDSLTVYLDNFEIWPLDPHRYYSAEFMDGDEEDPELVSADLSAQPTPTPIVPTATPTKANAASPTPTPMPFQGFLSVTGTITNSDTGAPVEGAAVYIDGYPDSRAESFYGGMYIMFALLFNAKPPFTFVVEKDGFQRYEKVLTEENLAASLTLDVALTPTGSPTPVPGSTPTPKPTPTPFIWLPTPTNTPASNGAATGLRLTACYPYGGSPYGGINVFVDLIDAQGRIVNPGTEGGDAPLTATVSVTGSAGFSLGTLDRKQVTEVLINNPFGANVTLYDQLAESVIVSATAANLRPAAPVSVEFFQTGLIQGKLRVWDGEKYIEPSVAFTLDVDTYNAETDHYFPAYFFYNKRDGTYNVGGLAPGTYSIRFNPKENLQIPIQGDPLGETLEWKCFDNVVVEARKITTLDVDLGPRKPGGRIDGTLVRSDGKPVRSSTVNLFPANYIIGQPPTYCDAKYFSETIYNATADPDFVAKFEFKNVPPGTYVILASDIDYDLQAQEAIFFHNGSGDAVNVSMGQTTEVVVTLDPGGAITPLSPVNYDRVNGTPLFTWSVKGDAAWPNLRINVWDRCGQTVWNQIVNGTQVPYGGSALSNQNLYLWYVLPDFANAIYGGFMAYTAGAPYFLVE